MPEIEEPLAGGNVNGPVVRIGATVRRTAGPWTPAVHALLEHLYAVGFRGAPRPLGLDERGREVLEFVPGQPAWPVEPFHRLDPDDQLARVGRLIRELHDTVAGFTPPADAQDHEWQRAVTAESANLATLAETLADTRDVLTAARLLVGSRPLPVLGLRSARPIAEYFGYFGAKIHPDVRVLDGGGSLLVDRLEQARAAGAAALLTFVLPRYPAEALAALRDAREAGLTVVTVTDSAMSPAAELSDVVLPAPVGSQLVFDLHTAPMALAMVLLQAMCDAAPASTQERLESFERSAARRGLFTP